MHENAMPFSGGRTTVMGIRLLSADDYNLHLLPGVKAAEAVRNQQAALAIAERFFAGN
jgi:hypothetical protein